MVPLEVDWDSVEVHNLTVNPLNLILYMYLRIFEDSSNIFMTNFRRIDSKVDSFCRDLRRYWSVTSDMCLNSKSYLSF